MIARGIENIRGADDSTFQQLLREQRTIAYRMNFHQKQITAKFLVGILSRGVRRIRRVKLQIAIPALMNIKKDGFNEIRNLIFLDTKVDLKLIRLLDIYQSFVRKDQALALNIWHRNTLNYEKFVPLTRAVM